jgi:hypothetical protein
LQYIQTLIFTDFTDFFFVFFGFFFLAFFGFFLFLYLENGVFPPFSPLKRRQSLVAKRKAAVSKYAKNIDKRGTDAVKAAPKDEGSGFNPILIGFFIFVVAGSAIFQVIQNAFKATNGQDDFEM